MNPIIFNCFLLYIFIVILSLLQSRLRLFKDDPVTYIILLVVMPFLVLGKAKGIKTWTDLTLYEIVAYTLVISYLNAKRLLPKINEGFIYAYTLLHWYLLFDAMNRVGGNFWNILVAVISIFPTILILKSAYEHKRLVQREKIILCYWFLFTVFYCYISQVAQSIIKPVLTAPDISVLSTLIIFLSAIQLYFIAIVFCLLFLAIPLFHLEKGSESFSVRWKKAMKDWRRLLNHKLDHYIEYQINYIQILYITCSSLFLFYIDASYASMRPYTLMIYTIVLPLVYFYFKAVPGENLEEELLVQEKVSNRVV